MELGAEGPDAALLGEQLADIAAQVLVVLRGVGVLQDLSEDSEQGLREHRCENLR